MNEVCVTVCLSLMFERVCVCVWRARPGSKIFTLTSGPITQKDESTVSPVLR